jgi:hypothetical protein
MQPINVTPEQLLQWVITILALSAVLVPIIEFLVEKTKGVLGPNFPSRFYPVVSLIWGIILGLIASGFLTFDIRLGILIGAAGGLGASKVYEYGKDRELDSIANAHYYEEIQ